MKTKPYYSRDQHLLQNTAFSVAMGSLEEMTADINARKDDLSSTTNGAKTEDLNHLLERCIERLNKAEASLANISEMENRVNEKGFEVQSQITRTAESMIATIQRRKCEMGTLVKSAMKAKQKALSSQKSKLSSYVESLKSSIEYSKDILNSDDGDACQWRPALVELLREVVNEQVDHEPAADESFELTVSEEENIFDLEEFFMRLCTRRRSHLSSNGQVKW